MLGVLTSIRATQTPMKSRRAMLETLFNRLNMVRLSVAAAALALMVGCTGLISGEGDQGLTPEQKHALDEWAQKAWPAFQQAGCPACHAGSQADIAFLQGATTTDVRSTLMGFSPQVVNTDAVQSSRVLTKGPHAGPALTAQQASDILEWIQAEADAAGGTGSGTSIPLETSPFQFQLCTSGQAGDPTCPINHVDVSALPNAPALPGAHIDFVVQPLANDIYVTDLYANAGADGLYIEHPLFVYIPPTGTMCSNNMAPPCPDPIDRFFNIKLDLMANGRDWSGGGGTAAFAGFAPVAGAQLQLTFKVVDKYRPDTSGGTGTTGGCKCLTAGANGCNGMGFQQLVVPVMNVNLTGEGNHCSGCHTGQNANATSAMDLTGIGSTDTSATGALQIACNQVRSRIDFTNIPNSGVILAPESGQDAAHPFKFANQATNFNNFKTALVNWANAEKVAP